MVSYLLFTSCALNKFCHAGYISYNNYYPFTPPEERPEIKAF
jgi:hypothetical protein